MVFEWLIETHKTFYGTTVRLYKPRGRQQHANYQFVVPQLEAEKFMRLITFRTYAYEVSGILIIYRDADQVTLLPVSTSNSFKS